MAVALDRLRHNGVVDHRQHLLQVVAEQLEVEDRVTVVLYSQELVLRQIGRLRPVLLVGAACLVLQRQHRRRQEPFEPEQGALLDAERRAAVPTGIAQQLAAAANSVGRRWLKSLAARFCWGGVGPFAARTGMP